MGNDKNGQTKNIHDLVGIFLNYEVITLQIQISILIMGVTESDNIEILKLSTAQDSKIVIFKSFTMFQMVDFFSVILFKIFSIYNKN